MKEYIERDALMLRIKEIHCAECDSYNGLRCRACLVDDALDYIDSEPAADVATVRHGEWEIVVGSNGKEYMVCTCCRVSQDLTGVFSYCPRCVWRWNGGCSEWQ